MEIVPGRLAERPGASSPKARSRFVEAKTLGLGLTKTRDLYLDSGMIELRGNLVVGPDALGGAGMLAFTGASDQTYAFVSGLAPEIRVNKTGGTVSAAPSTTALSMRNARSRDFQRADGRDARLADDGDDATFDRLRWNVQRVERHACAATGSWLLP
jgi:hypothetical protein